MKYKILILPLYLLLHTQNPNVRIAKKNSHFFPHFWQLKTSKITSFLNFEFFSQVRNRAKKFRVACEDLVALILSLWGYSFTHFILGGSVLCVKKKK
jgi:hypothetical protein